MSIYSAGTAAYRDTTKWLVAFVPIAAILSAGAVAGPGLVNTIGNADSIRDFFEMAGWPVAGLVAVSLGIIAVVWRGSVILSLQPTELGAVVADPELMSAAFGAGVGAPYFFDRHQFEDAMTRLLSIWDSGQPPEPSDPLLTRAIAATEALREWSLHRQLGAAFGGFRKTFGWSVIAIVTGLMVAAVSLQPGSDTIATPTRVLIDVSDSGGAALTTETGCHGAAASEFWAVGGNWDAPTLQVDGPGCRFGAQWKPDPDVIELRLPQGSDG